MSYLLNL